MYNELDMGCWANMNPSMCPCRNGWFLSTWDTWHRCPFHGEGVPHPEAEDDFDHAAHNLHVSRLAYAYFRDAAERAGMTRDAFRKAVTDRVAPGCTSAAEWVDAADEVAAEILSETAEAQAQEAGFFCYLEAAWAADAADESHGIF